MKTYTIIVFLLTAFALLACSRKDQPKPGHVLSLTGICTALIVEEARGPDTCNGTLVYSDSPNGERVFRFPLKKGFSISFFGDRNKIRSDGNAKVQPVESLLAAPDADRSAHGAIHAVGECLYSDEDEDHSFVRCSATTKIGLFSVDFLIGKESPRIN